MSHRHPLENPSLAPYGFVFPRYRERLEYAPKTDPFWANPEKIIARLWDRWNRAGALRPWPIKTIVHEILPSQASANRLARGDFSFDGLPYLSRDIMVLSSVVQWLGTNVGRSFLEDALFPTFGKFNLERVFLIKLAIQMEHRDMVAFWTHTCTKRCSKEPMTFWSDGCFYDSKAVSQRDRAVVDGLMRWLGKSEGRAFAAEFARRKKNAYAAGKRRKCTNTSAQTVCATA